MADEGILGADLLLRLGIDASGVQAELSSKLTAAERQATASGARIGTAVATGSNKATVAQLRLVTATERYNAVLKREGVTQGQVAASQASLISARDRYTAATTTSTRVQERHASSTLASAKSLTSVALFLGGAKALHDGVKVLGEYQANLAQTGAALASTGGVAHVTSEEIQALGEKVQGYSGQSREAIIHSENLLLTFTNVRNEVGAGNDIFTRATTSLADLAARGFGTAETNAKALGRALQDPISGLTLLRRSGITFTKAQQDQVKNLAKSNHLLEAQRFILDVINQKVGGSAEAFGKTLPGEIAITKHSLEDVERTIIGVTQPLIKGAATVASFIGSNGTARNVTTGLVAGGAALALANKAVKLYGEISANVFRRQAEKVTGNLSVAASYDAVAVAATGAARAEGAASVGGLGAGRRGLFRGSKVVGGIGALGLIGGISAQHAGGGGLLSGAANIGGGALLGAEIGSVIPGVGTAIGAGVGAAAGIGLTILGPHGPAQRTNRTPAQIKAERARIVAQIQKISASNDFTDPGLTAHMIHLQASAAKLGDELKQSQLQAKETIDVMDPLTGKVEALTVAQLAAATASAAHADALKKQKEAHKALRESFAVDAFAGAPETSTAGASASQIHAAELRLRAAQDRAATKGRTASEHASVISAQATLDKLRSQGGPTGLSPAEALRRLRGTVRGQKTLASDIRTLERRGLSREGIDALRTEDAAAPGTIHTIATSDAGKYAKEFNKGLKQLKHQTNVLATLYEGSDTLAEQRARRDARAYAKAYAEEMAGAAINFFTNGPTPTTPGNVPFAVAANMSNRRHKMP